MTGQECFDPNAYYPLPPASDFERNFSELKISANSAPPSAAILHNPASSTEKESPCVSVVLYESLPITRPLHFHRLLLF